ncbi:AAA family ATPase [Methylorubrum sp. B1-46]|uniref:ABC transporter ATP-binding protein n=1 Tax=Methylorubrum sp. B1-46 TaxID=2897334 RepID=UPI001E34B93B|nr:ABC transporter ATP-binding protein [Methylorubrum sp. B1-46]UGB27212.1 AAA family ATPase [Methylorubrum sp. B1-46]
MHISRVQVEEGFLNGLDLYLPPGLIAIIGARGTGKTSLVELIRYALKAPNHTVDAAKASIEHAQAVLGDGEIAVTLEDLLDEVHVSRTAYDEHSNASDFYLPPLIFSQKEIETVALTDQGRLSLIDSFVKDDSSDQSSEASIKNNIGLISRSIKSVVDEIDQLSSGINELPALRSLAQSLEKESLRVSLSSEDNNKRQVLLTDLTDKIIDYKLSEDYISRFVTQVQKVTKALSTEFDNSIFLEEWQTDVGRDPIPLLKHQFAAAVTKLTDTKRTLSDISAKADIAKQQIQDMRIEVEAQARSVRVEIEKIIEGAGQTSRQLSSIKNKIAQLEATEKNIKDRKSRLHSLHQQRNDLLDTLERIRSVRYSKRSDIAKKLNANLGPKIDIRIDRFGQYEYYAAALIAAFRGSGIRYNDLANVIVENVSPRELVHCVDTEDYAKLSNLTGITKDRAARAIASLKGTDLSSILVVNIEDSVVLQLLDGLEYKDVSKLSAGQRCTVILSIVLQHDDRTLIIDQPEDHIDNAFISETLIKSLRSRSKNSQIIVTTHNANIPVLGNASMIIQLVSDGRNATVEVCEKVDHPDSIRAITSIMEGGMQAFRDRAQFYADHQLP